MGGTPTSQPDSAPKRVIGRYALFDEIAAGGMATVHIGRLRGPVGFTRTVAIKRLHAQFAKDPEFVSMFLDEARLAARIQHPNVVQTIDVVAAEQELFLVMEYIKGDSLSSILNHLSMEESWMPPNIAGGLITGVLMGLHAAHEAADENGEPLGIVHRDVSPQNVLVGTDGVPRLIDFGVAKAAGRLQTTREGHLKGKLPYMARELLEGGAATRQSDIYAAGVVLYMCLTGQKLFEADHELGLVMAIDRGLERLPSELNPGLPDGIDEIVAKSLARDPSERYGDAREMALEVGRALGTASSVEIADWIPQVLGRTVRRKLHRVAEIERRDQGKVISAEQALEEATQPVAPAPTPVIPHPETSSVAVAMPSPLATSAPRAYLPWIAAGIAMAVAAVFLYAISPGDVRAAKTGGSSIRATMNRVVTSLMMNAERQEAELPPPVDPSEGPPPEPTSDATAAADAPAAPAARPPPARRTPPPRHTGLPGRLPSERD